MNEITRYMVRQIEWSARTFGPGRRTLGIIDHIKKELKEVEADPDDLTEWIDVIILAMDGYWRHGGLATEFLAALEAKQNKNMARKWPPPGPEDQATEHVREVKHCACKSGNPCVRTQNEHSVCMCDVVLPDEIRKAMRCPTCSSLSVIRAKVDGNWRISVKTGPDQWEPC